MRYFSTQLENNFRDVGHFVTMKLHTRKHVFTLRIILGAQLLSAFVYAIHPLCHLAPSLNPKYTIHSFSMVQSNKNHKYIPIFCPINNCLGRCGGQVVSVLALSSDDPSSNPADAYSFFSVKFVSENVRKNKKRSGLAH